MLGSNDAAEMREDSDACVLADVERPRPPSDVVAFSCPEEGKEVTVGAARTVTEDPDESEVDSSKHFFAETLACMQILVTNCIT